MKLVRGKHYVYSKYNRVEKRVNEYTMVYVGKAGKGHLFNLVKGGGYAHLSEYRVKKHIREAEVE